VTGCGCHDPAVFGHVATCQASLGLPPVPMPRSQCMTRWHLIFNSPWQPIPAIDRRTP
jgi:hypothetical protein